MNVASIGKGLTIASRTAVRTTIDAGKKFATLFSSKPTVIDTFVKSALSTPTVKDNPKLGTLIQAIFTKHLSPEKMEKLLSGFNLEQKAKIYAVIEDIYPKFLNPSIMLKENSKYTDRLLDIIENMELFRKVLKK